MKIIQFDNNIPCPFYDVKENKLYTNSGTMNPKKKYPMKKDQYDNYIIKYHREAKIHPNEKEEISYAVTRLMLRSESLDRQQEEKIKKDEEYKKKLYEKHKLYLLPEAIKNREKNLDILKNVYRTLTFNDVGDGYLDYPLILAKKVYLVFDTTINIGLTEGFKSFLSLVRSPFTKEKTSYDLKKILEIANSVNHEISIIFQSRKNLKFKEFILSKIGHYPYRPIRDDEFSTYRNIEKDCREEYKKWDPDRVTDLRLKQNEIYLKAEKEILENLEDYKEIEFIEKIREFCKKKLNIKDPFDELMIYERYPKYRIKKIKTR